MHIHAMCGRDVSASISVVDVRKNNNNNTDADPRGVQGGEEGGVYARVDCIAADAAEVLTSGAYRAGFCVCSTGLKSRAAAAEGAGRGGKQQSKTLHLQAGDYTVVLSAYTPESVGAFALTFATSAGADTIISSSSSGDAARPRHLKKYFTVKEVPPEGWGLRRLVLGGQWAVADQTAAGCVNSGSYHMNPLFLLHVSETKEMKCVCKCVRRNRLRACCRDAMM
jgi:hypothetical protein